MAELEGYTPGDNSSFENIIAGLGKGDEAPEGEDVQADSPDFVSEGEEADTLEGAGDDDQTDEDDEIDDESEGESAPRELVEKIFADPELQKVLKNRRIRELTEERAAWQQQQQQLIERASKAEHQATAYQKAMDEWFANQGGNKPAQNAPQDPAEAILAEMKEAGIDALDEDAARFFANKIAAMQSERGEEKKKGEESAQIAKAQAAYDSATDRSVATFTQATPDFEDAIKYWGGIEIARNKALGMSAGEAEQKFVAALDYVGKRAWSEGRDIAAAAYEAAKAIGYKPQAKQTVRKGPNLDKINENQAKTSPSRPGSAVGLGGDQNPLAQMKAIAKGEGGRVDPAEFKKLLAKYGG